LLDETPFSNDPESESSIFVTKYFSSHFLQDRATLSTTFVLLRADGEACIEEHNYRHLNAQQEVVHSKADPLIIQYTFKID
jgi:hypothetical protein